MAMKVADTDQCIIYANPPHCTEDHMEHKNNLEGTV